MIPATLQRTAALRRAPPAPSAACSAIARASRIARAALLGSALLAGCAGLPPTEEAEPTRILEARDAFSVAGRISVAKGSEGFSGSFRWEASPGSDRIDLVSPLGQTVAQLAQAGGRVTMRTGEGREANAESWEALTERELGWPLPVSGLRYWIQGVPRPGAPAARVGDASGRIAGLRQDGWSIVYRYRDEEPGGERPAGLRLSYHDVEVRIAIDQRDR